MEPLKRFVDRKGELSALERDWKAGGSAFVVVYGRRRIGKTRLVERFLEGKAGFRYTAEDANSKIQLGEFRQAMASYLKDDFLAGEEISGWGPLFAYLSKALDRKSRFYIWIDEFSYLVKNDSSITSALQKFIDGFLRDSSVFFIVSGSLFGLMSEKVLSHSSPLYGRRTRDLLLEQIPAGFAQEFLGWSLEDSLKAAMTIGGVPEYLRVASKFPNHAEFVSAEFFKPSGYFLREPMFLLSQEFKEIKTYFSILNAIAFGNSKPVDIANFAGLDAREIYPYLELLISYGFVLRQTPLLGDSKRGVYSLNEAFFDFWFNFVHKNRDSISRGGFAPVQGALDTFLGRRFEALVRSNFGSFFKGFDVSGRWWHADKEIDAVAVREKGREILFAECKWKDGVDAREIAVELAAKTQYVEWHSGERKETLAVFAKSFSRRITEFEGRRVHCIDLKDLGALIR
ncbi:MAG: ATP-binding protein [Candidatus Micrarchaeota archaeon]